MIEIPSKLRQRPKFKGLPIPYTTFISPEGVPDFKVIDEYSRLLCIERRKCALCGQELKKNKPIVFIGGDKSCDAGNFLDPAMHEECALYAIKVCPYLVGTHSHRTDHDQSRARVIDMVVVGRPKRMGLYYTRGYDAILTIDQSIYVKAWPPTKIDWDVIPLGPEPVESEPESEPEPVVTANFVPQ